VSVLADELIEHMPPEHREMLRIAYQVLRTSAPSEGFEIGRAYAVAEFLEFYGIPGVDRIVSRWSCEGVDNRETSRPGLPTGLHTAPSTESVAGVR